MNAPAYFEAIRLNAVKRWVQLDNDPVLAGPWRQLFKQVQSPRHVISELLQNADDAGATRAIVGIEDDDFIFIHDGEDFTEEHFRSLCRFGYSNKRALHTIGFRGVGFKSTFSIGDKVCLNTPSLSVAFHRERFTEPVWQTRDDITINHTEIRVKISDQYRLKELKKNLDDWKQSPASLLFFNSIRCLEISGQEIRWEPISPGPIKGSRWMALSSAPNQRFLLIQSDQEEFPDEALEEIRHERMIQFDENASFPPCKIEIVLGMGGDLFVILPTGVKTNLPFACNAPFIQDPARLKIKDPEISPTNRWLLERVGKLASKVMLEWLGREDFEIKERCNAYSLLPDVNREDHSIEGNCARIVEEACETILSNESYLITEGGSLKKEKECIAVPDVLLDIWSLNQIILLFGKNSMSILSRHIKPEHKRKLANWKCFNEIDKEYVLSFLKSKHMPKPETWEKLLYLWAYLANDLVSHHYGTNHKNVKIFPAQEKDVLFSAGDVVRFGEKKIIQSQEDFDFLDNYLIILDQAWLRYIADQKKLAEQARIEELGKKVAAAYNILDALGLAQATDASRVIKQVSDKFFAQERCNIIDCVRLAQIAASLGATVSEDFKFVTRDGCLRRASECIVYDAKNDIDFFVSKSWYESHVLNEDYRVSLSSSEEEWMMWVESERSRLVTFLPLIQTSRSDWSRTNIIKFLTERGAKGDPHFPYKLNNFTIEDFDFDKELWQFWKISSIDNPIIYGHLFDRIIDQHKGYWANALSAKVWQNANVYRQPVTNEEMSPAWIIKFCDLPCLQDTRGKYRQPAELLRRTPDTEYLLDIEPFVRAEYDIEANRKLLDLLGVRNTPTGPERLLERIRALATAATPPVYEVEKWCRRLDQMSVKCSTEEFQQIKTAFNHEKIILTADTEWVSAPEIFINADEDAAPGAAILHPAFKELSIWRKIGISERPTGELALKWLAEIPSNKKLTKEELKRVRALLPRYAERIWLEYKHWLNLDGEWAPVDELLYKLTMQTLTPWSDLFRPIKQKTADMQKLNYDLCGQYPFSDIPSLASSIEHRFEHKISASGEAQEKEWLYALGSCLAHIELEDDEESRQTRELGRRLSLTKLQVVTSLESTPYIDGTPAGTPRSVDVVWKDTILYIENKSMAKMAKTVAHELGKNFRADIADAIKLCFERNKQFIIEYMEENFKLLPATQLSKTETTFQASDKVQTTSHDENIKSLSYQKADEEYDSEIILDTQIVKLDANRYTNTDIGQDKGFVNDFDNGDELELDEESDNNNENDDSAPNRKRIYKDGNGDYFGSPDKEHGKSDFNENTGENSSSKRKKSLQATKPNLIELYALSRGFKKDSGENRFYREDGAWIERTSGVSFPWEEYSVSGELVRCYWVKSHCIEMEPLEIESEVWELCIGNPEKYTIILTTSDGDPVTYSGKQIREMLERGRLTLFPASYRLVYDQGANMELDQRFAKLIEENNE